MNQLSIKELIASVIPSKRREAHLQANSANPELEALSMPVTRKELKPESNQVDVGGILRDEGYSV